jgi:hypothetical protein
VPRKQKTTVEERPLMAASDTERWTVFSPWERQ